jgi:heptosyltransferase III
MNVLFITSSRIGDAVLSTGLLDHIARTWPKARVTIACGPLSASLFEGYPNLERIIPLKKQKFNKHWIDLLRQVSRIRWEFVVDLRNSAVSRVLRAEKRYVFGNHIDDKLHKVEQNAQVMNLSTPPAPKLWFTEKQLRKAQELIPDGSQVLGIGPTANWLAKTWPAERFIEIAKFMTDEGGPMEGARVAVFAAPGEEHAAHEVLNSVPIERRIDVVAKADPGTVAAAIARCSFYIGNDSGLMHCAAANGVKTLGLFGPSYPHLYRPWGPHCNYARTPETYNELINYKGYDPKTAPCLMNTLGVETVKKKLTDLINR